MSSTLDISRTLMRYHRSYYNTYRGYFSSPLPPYNKPISGYATLEGTKRFAERHSDVVCEPPSPGHVLTPGLKLWLSRVGFGAHRVTGTTAQRVALRLALESGCNVVDSAPTFGGGNCERAVGDVLAECFADGIIKRDEICVMSKVGVIDRRQDGADIVNGATVVSDALAYSLEPTYLRSSIRRSMDQLGVSVLDVVFINNPEMLLATSKNEMKTLQQFEDAFAVLEEEVKHGRIRHYGISGNLFGSGIGNTNNGGTLSLTTIMDTVTKRHGSEHYLRAVQVPCNVFEHNLATDMDLRHNVESLACFGQRPFTAILPQKKLRYLNISDQKLGNSEDVVTTENSSSSEDIPPLSDTLTAAVALEKEYIAIMSERKESSNILNDETNPGWASELMDNPSLHYDVAVLERFWTRYIMPDVDNLCPLYEKSADAEMKGWFNAYRSAMKILRKSSLAEARHHAASANRELAVVIDSLRPELRLSPTLTQKLVRVTSAMPINCLLVGMRTPDHVTDVLYASSKHRDSLHINETFFKDFDKIAH